MVQLRDYQQECIEKILNMSEREKKIACLPTGAGKTIIMSEICRRVNSRILIVVQSSELRQQTLDKLKMVCGESVDAGSVQGNLKEWDNRIIVATRQTLTSNNRIEFKALRLLQSGKFEYVIFDECHVAIKQQKKIIENLNKDVKVLGLTATPYNVNLKEIYRGFIYKRELIDMIKDRYLVEPVCYEVHTDTDLNNVEVARGDFVQEQLSDAVNIDYRNNLIVKSYIEKCQSNGRNKTIVFCTTVEHSKKLAECFNQNGIKAISIDGSCNKKDREKILKDFHEGKYKVLCNVNILTTGFDEPATDSIIFARCTLSKGLYIQMLGRGLRLSPETGKKDCLIIDIVDVATKHNIISSKTIFDVKDGETPTKAIRRKTREKIQKEQMEELKNEINEQTEEIIEEVQEQEENININNIQVNYSEENILVERDIKENFGRLQSAEKSEKTEDAESEKNRNNSNKNINKNTNKEKNKKSLIGGLFRKIFNLSL